VAAVIDLRGRSVRIGSDGRAAQANKMLRRIRIVEADRIEAGFGGDRSGPTALGVLPKAAEPLIVNRCDRDAGTTGPQAPTTELTGHYLRYG
jgi:hypothetical protein